MKRIVILGGSSPFVIGLFSALDPYVARLASTEIVLHGRAAARLEAVAAYARARLGPAGPKVSAETDLDKVLAGADIVINQIRFGGLDARQRDEQLATDFGLIADETVGPSGLLSAICQTEPLIQLGRKLRQACPSAWILNLTNPLSVATALLAQEMGAARVVGLCELPTVTAQGLARLVDLPFEALSWSYTGLNHRGFIHDLTAGGESLLPLVLDRLGDGDFAGIPARTIADLGAVPLKYFRFFCTDAVPAAGRAAELMQLTDRLAAQLERDPATEPAGSRDRHTPWYDHAVAPALHALVAGEPFVTTANFADDGGGIRPLCERKVRFAKDGIELLADRPPPGPVRTWVERFEAQEDAILAACFTPSVESVAAALERDPLVPPRVVPQLARRIMELAGAGPSVEATGAA